MYPDFIVGWILDEQAEMLGLTAFPRNQDKRIRTPELDFELSRSWTPAVSRICSSPTSNRVRCPRLTCCEDDYCGSYLSQDDSSGARCDTDIFRYIGSRINRCTDRYLRVS